MSAPRICDAAQTPSRYVPGRNAPAAFVTAASTASAQLVTAHAFGIDLYIEASSLCADARGPARPSRPNA